MGNVLIGKANVFVVSSRQQASKTVPTLPMPPITLRMKAQSWAASKSARCPWLPMHQMGFGLQLDSGDYVLGWEGDGKCLKRFGGPGEIRASRPLPCHLRNINHLRTLPPETKDLAHGDLDAGGRHGAILRRLDSARTPAL